MQSSLSWIEWLDRLDRVLNAAREDVRAWGAVNDPRAVEAVERCRRQLSALTSDLRLLDRSVIAAKSATVNSDRASNLQKALDTAVSQLAAVASAPIAESRSARERRLTSVDSALRDSCYEAAMLLGPSRRRA
jgi:hypothetical protein